MSTAPGSIAAKCCDVVSVTRRDGWERVYVDGPPPLANADSSDADMQQSDQISLSSAWRQTTQKKKVGTYPERKVTFSIT